MPPQKRTRRPRAARPLAEEVVFIAPRALPAEPPRPPQVVAAPRNSFTPANALPASTSSIIILVSVGVALLAILGSTYYYHEYQRERQNPGVGDTAALDEQIKEVSELMLIAPGAKPEAVAITDKTKLQNQPFFQEAENGDTVIILPTQLKAVLYRPTLHKIIDITAIRPSSGAQ